MQFVEADADELAGLAVESADGEPIGDDVLEEYGKALVVSATRYVSDAETNGQAFLEGRLYLQVGRLLHVFLREDLVADEARVGLLRHFRATIPRQFPKPRTDR